MLVVLDQLPVKLLEEAAPYLTGGLARLAGEDGAQGIGVYPYATTQTCPGHVTLATGAEPARSGIVANEMLNPDGTTTYCADLSLLQVQSIGDAASSAGGLVVGLSHKDRSALFLGGTSATRVAWYDVASDTVVHGEDLITDVRKAEIWSELWQPDPRLVGVREDARAFEGWHGLESVFPHGPASALSGKARLATPAAGELLTDLAIAAVDRHGLGAEAGRADLMTVSYSNTDYVGHYFTASSLEALDNLLRVDAQLGRLFAHLDQQVGAEGWRVLLTSDHGGQEQPSHYIRGRVIEERVAAAFAEHGVPGRIVLSWPEATVVGVPEQQRTQALDLAVTALSSVEGVRAAFLTDAIPEGPIGDAVRLSFFEGRSAPIYAIPEEGVVFDWYDGHGSDHGSPYAYDQRVPLMMYGAGVRKGYALGDVDTRQVAPTIAAMMGIRPPADARMAPLTEALEL